MKVQTVMMAPDTDQYAGDGQARTGVAAIVDAARRAEALGFDGVTMPEAGHDPFLPLAIAAEHTERISLGTNVAIAFPRSQRSDEIGRAQRAAADMAEQVRNALPLRRQAFGIDVLVFRNFEQTHWIVSQ